MKKELKDLLWVGASKKELLKLPTETVDVFGYAFYLAQVGLRYNQSKPLKGFGSGVFEVVDNAKGDTYRAVYAVKVGKAVYVLHCFRRSQKMALKHLNLTIDMIKERLKIAKEHAKGENNG